MTTKNAIVYARVSTDDQADKGFSLAAQVDAGRKYADARGMTVTQELIDDGVSGATAFSERPAGATAWALLRSDKAHALIVQNVDRLSRDVVDLLVTIRALLRAGVEVHCLDLGRVTSEYDIMLVIRGWQGSDERQKINRRMMGGKRQKASEGMVICTSRPPYGYDYERDEKGRVVNFTINEEKAAIVRLIFRLYTEGDGKIGPLSLRGVGRRLTESGIALPWATRAGRIGWTATTVTRILQNRAYRGEWQYTAKASGDLPEETFTIAIPAIVDAATWDAAQVQMERNIRKSKRNGKREYLLTGIVQCGCGHTMTGYATIDKKTDKEYRYYHCCGRKARYSGIEEQQCSEKTVRADTLEAAAWDVILDRIKNAATLEADLREAQRREDAEREPKTAELDAVLAMMVEAEIEADKLALSFTRLSERDQADGAVGRALQKQIREVDERHKALVARREVLEAELSHRRFTEEAIQRQLDFVARLRAGVENATNEDKRGMLDTLDAQVFVKDGEAQLEYHLNEKVLIELQPSKLAKNQSIPLTLSRTGVTQDRPAVCKWLPGNPPLVPEFRRCFP